MLELWCWSRLLRVLWTARRSNQSILREINPEYSLEGLMWKLKLQYFRHLIWRTDSLEKAMIWEDWRQEEKGTTEDEMVGWHHQLNRHEFERALGVNYGQGNLTWRSPRGCRVGHDWVTELNWPEFRSPFLEAVANKHQVFFALLWLYTFYSWIASFSLNSEAICPWNKQTKIASFKRYLTNTFFSLFLLILPNNLNWWHFVYGLSFPMYIIITTIMLYCSFFVKVCCMCVYSWVCLVKCEILDCSDYKLSPIYPL